MSTAGPRPLSRRRVLTLAAGSALPLPGCRRKEAPAPAAQTAAWLLTPGAPPPDWSRLDAWQGKVTRTQFTRLLEDVLTDGQSWVTHIEVRTDAAHIRMSTPATGGARYVLAFAPEGTAAGSGPRYWRRRDELPALTNPARPLDGVHIALDPGHIGGAYARMEQRYNQPDPSAPAFKEGDLTLRTARVLAPALEELGARVSLVRSAPEPLTPLRPAQLMDAARASLHLNRQPDDAVSVEREAERLFYRAAEIRARAALVNDKLRPDLVLCIHYNGDGSGDRYSTANHLHVLAHGCIGGDEFPNDDQRLDGLLRLVQDIPGTEIPLCTAVARRMAEATALPAYTYRSGARMAPGEPFVWLRNLLANRLYLCPVVYLEPWVQNNREVIARFTAGDYEGTAPVAGWERPSIFREYSAGVTAGLRDWFAERRSA